MQHGGKREGAGRPRKESRVLREEGVVKHRLRGGAELGWDALADDYYSLIRAAIDLALGNPEEGIRPNVPMLKTLLELMPKVVGPGDEAGECPMAQLVKGLHVKLTATSDPD